MKNFQWIKTPDARTRLSTVWHDWFTEVSQIQKQFATSQLEDDPFAYNETASVSVFASAASRVNLLSLAEFTCKKKSKDDKRKAARGRSDLWVLSEELNASWAFEFKVCWIADGISQEKILKYLALAVDDAKHVHQHEADRRFGIVLYTDCANWQGKEPLTQFNLSSIAEFINKNEDYQIHSAALFNSGFAPTFCVIVDVRQ